MFLFPSRNKIEFYSFHGFTHLSPPHPTPAPLFTKALPRQRIQLAFDKNYYIEPSFECRFDHIEIRDGPFGFSPLIDRFCGGKNPGLVTSTGRFMWIKFTSDEELEGLGFRIKYTFIAGQDSLNRMFAADATITTPSGSFVSFPNTSKTFPYVQRAESGYCALEKPPPNHERQSGFSLSLIFLQFPLYSRGLREKFWLLIHRPAMGPHGGHRAVLPSLTLLVIRRTFSWEPPELNMPRNRRLSSGDRY